MVFSKRKSGAEVARRLAEVEARFAAISKSQAVIEFNLDGTIRTANDNFLQALGYGLAEIQGKHHAMFVDPADRNSADYKDFWRALNAGTFVAAKFRRLAKGGREVWIQASYNPIFDAQGRPEGVIKIATDITAAEQQSAERETARVGAERAQSTVVAALGDGLARMAGGKLTFRIEQAFAPDYEGLRADFNAAMARLDDTLGVISAATCAMQSGAGEISAAADDLSRRTEQQAASLEETAAALDEITATVRRTAQGASQAHDVVGRAKTDAERSSQVVRDAVAAMGEIETSSKQIGNIIGVIDEIAFQTNLLALNAGVEAARAGDAGKGFAVVASEVRALAQRSADAAKEIKTLISASTAQVAQGVTLVGQTGEALTRIAAQVADINGVVVEIAASAQEQATGLAQVNDAVNQMDQVTQQNAAMVEQSTAASHGLATQGQQLRELVSRFEVSGVEAAAPARTAAVRQLRTTGAGGRSGGAARRPEPASEGWDAF